MKLLFFILLVMLTLTSCSLFEGSEGDGPPCESVTPIDGRIRNAIPYSDGQMLTFEASDGTGFMATVTERSFTPSRIDGCKAETVITFSGINVNNSLDVRINLFGDDSALDFNVRYNVNGNAGNSFSVTLNENGEVNNGSSVSRVIADTTLNGESFRNVLLTKYHDLNNPAIRSTYYNVTSGFIGVELTEGTTLFLRE